MQLVLVSACLLGQPVRYDGRHQQARHSVLARWLAQRRVLAVCPEVAGGLPVRAPAEIVGGDALQVLAGQARVLDAQGVDVSAAFVRGARQALDLARLKGVRLAVLKDNSPSCGSRQVYDGRFRHTRGGPGRECRAVARRGSAGLQRSPVR
jgi:uncharacterized protein YbbK (DUF523 family)